MQKCRKTGRDAEPVYKDLEHDQLDYSSAKVACLTWHQRKSKYQRRSVGLKKGFVGSRGEDFPSTSGASERQPSGTQGRADGALYAWYFLDRSSTSFIVISKIPMQSIWKALALALAL